MKTVQIAIDGPAGAGKSTVARLVARSLGFLYIDTGAMYRAICLRATELGVEWTDEEMLERLAVETEVTLLPGDPTGEGPRVFLDGREVTEEIRSPVVDKAVSLVAKVPGVRQRLLLMQRELAQVGSVVMDGRDIGTTVLPNAELKVFLTASLEERTRRRYLQLVSRGIDVERDSVRVELEARDRLDSGRRVAPLRKADDAVEVDTTGLSISEVVERVLAIACKTRD